MRLALPLVVLVFALAGCGGGDDGGRATLWVTRDRGAEKLIDAEVPAGLTALAALRREADVETRYGGRFVQSVDGLGGSLTAQRDWFWFVNGYEGDRSAAEYRLHDGDVLWWDYRSWAESMQQPLVVGAFPEPFLHGWNGETRETVVVGEGEAARAIADILGATVGASADDAPRHAHLFVIERGSGRLEARYREDGGAPGDPVVFTASADVAAALAEEPAAARFRYEGVE